MHAYVKCDNFTLRSFRIFRRQEVSLELRNRFRCTIGRGARLGLEMYATYVNSLYPGWMLAVNIEADLPATVTSEGWLLTLRMSREDLECMTQDLGVHKISKEQFCLFRTTQSRMIFVSSLGGLLATVLMLPDYQRLNSPDCAEWLKANMISSEFRASAKPCSA
jgi:hypothetical protein